MNTYDLGELRLTHLMCHQVGNKSKEEGTRISNQGTSIKRDALEPLMRFFTRSFKGQEFFNFALDAELGENKVYSIVKRLFGNQQDFVSESQQLAELLYDAQDHPNTKSGILMVVRMEEAMLDGEIVDVIGLFKAEETTPFLKIDPIEDSYAIDSDEGFDIGRLDRGCIVFKSNVKEGYRVLIHNAKASEASFWNDSFLKVTESKDEYHQTKDFMHITRDFVQNQLPSEFEVDKADRIALLNRSMEYFSQKDSFDKEEFAAEVFEDEQVVKSFNSFDNQYREQHHMEPSTQFDISTTAVKKQGNVFRSVLKLDKNFHIYIHGDREQIQRGQEEDGRKYYKIYFEKES